MMQPIQIGNGGFTFLLERNGFLIATSTLTPVISSNLTRVNTLESCNHSGIAAAVKAIVKVFMEMENLVKQFQKFKNLTYIEDQVSLEFYTDGDAFYLSAAPFVVDPDIDWLLFIAYPRHLPSHLQPCHTV